MFYKLVILFVLFLCNFQLFSQTTSTPTPFINGINLITGKAEELHKKKFEYTFHKDNKVKSIKEIDSSLVTEFNYFPRGTEVVENQTRKNVYHFYDNQLVSSVEHYQLNGSKWELYRKERLFWNKNAQLTSRVLEDARGVVNHCTMSAYNSKGQLIKETLYGNLSGICSIPVVIQKEGIPLSNGVESYSVNYEYAADGSLLKQSNDQGITTHYQYNKNKQCTGKLIGNQSQIISRCFYEYDSIGCLSKTIVDDGNGRDSHDLSGVTSRQIMATEASREAISFGQPLVIENQYLDLKTNGIVTLDKMLCRYSGKGELIQQDLYDADGKLLSSTKGDQTPVLSENNDEQYLPELQCTIVKDSNGNETKSFHDCFGRVIDVQLPQVLDENNCPYQPKIIQKYNICDYITSIQDPSGNVTETTYTARGKPACVTHPDGSTETFIYFLDGELSEKINRNGSKTVITRDSFGRTGSICDYSLNQQLTKRLVYSYEGTKIKTITDENAFTATLEYDGAGRKTGYSIQTKDGLRRVDYSEEKDNTEEGPENPIHSEVKMTGNNRGQFVKLEEIVDKQGIKQCKTYDALDRLENVASYNSLGIKLAEKDIRYNSANQKIVEKHHVYSQGKQIRTYTINWEYDINNKLTAIHEGVGTTSQKNTYHQYNIFGQLIKTVKPNGATLHYSYNEAGLMDKSWAGDQSFSYEYEYDNKHRLVEVHDLIHGYDQQRQYDSFDQLINEKCKTANMHYEYDGDGRCTLITLPDGSFIQYGYQDSLLSSIDRIGNNGSLLYSHGYSYDSESKMLQQSELAGKIGSIHYQYDHEKKLIGIKSPWWTEQVTSKDDCGRLTGWSNDDLIGKSKQTYSYTADGQLASDTDHNYVYDSVYNRINENGKNWAVNEINQLIQTQQCQFKYDQNGNMIEKSGPSGHLVYSYDAMDRLIKIELDRDHAIEYVYDAFNRRIAEKTISKKSTETAQYIYLQEKEIGKINEHGKIVELRIIGINKGSDTGAAVAIEIDGRTFAPIHDRSGSVRSLIDIKTKAVAECYRYSSFGVEEIYNANGDRIETSAVKNPWRYVSKRVEDKSHLVFFGLRYYDPEIGRWITPDPLSFADTPNLYAFVRNDAINHFDNYGLFSLSSIWEYAKETVSSCISYFRLGSQHFRNQLCAELYLPDSVCDSINCVGRALLGESTCLLLGNSIHKSHIDVYGEHEINDKVRITYINGILNNTYMLYENLDLISNSHGGVKVHYIFRGTKGWTWDIAKAIAIRIGYNLGYRSSHAYLLAETWRELIEEMGGVNGGGVIIHYAHSLGGSDTDRARTLLTPEEQKMIRVFTFGSATLVRNEGFQSVVNIISANDGVCSILLEPLGHIRNYFDPNSNVRKYGYYWQIPFWGIPIWPTDHLLNGYTYKPILLQLGEYFLEEFG